MPLRIGAPRSKLINLLEIFFRNIDLLKQFQEFGDRALLTPVVDSLPILFELLFRFLRFVLDDVNLTVRQRAIEFQIRDSDTLTRYVDGIGSVQQLTTDGHSDLGSHLAASRIDVADIGISSTPLSSGVCREHERQNESN